MSYAQFWPPLNQNTFGSRALPGPNGGAYSAPPDSLSRFGGGDEGKGGIESEWIRKRGRVGDGKGRVKGRNETVRGVGEETQQGREYDQLDNSPMLAGLQPPCG